MINLKIVNKSSQKSVNIDIKNIVNNHTDFLVFSDIVSERNINIAYYETPSVNSLDNIVLSKKNTSVKYNHSNWFDIEDNVIEINSKTFYLPYRDCLITNVLSDPNQEGQRVPLFYQHKAKDLIKEVSLTWLNSMSRLNSNFEYKLLDGILYVNLDNKFDKATSHYSLCNLSGVYNDGSSFNEILNPIKVARELTWEDIDENTGDIKKGLLRYEMSVNEGQKYFEYNILYDRYDNALELNCIDQETFLNLSKFYIKGLTSNIIELNKPEEYSLDSPWYLKISNGEFFANNSHYKISEFDSQIFNPFYGSKYAVDKKCWFITGGYFKTTYDNIIVNEENDLYLNLYEKDLNQEILSVYTNNPSLNNKEYSNTGVKYQYVTFKADEKNGIVLCDKNLNASYLYTADFYFICKDYQYIDVDFNFVNNDDFINHYYAIFIKPNAISFDIQDKLGTESIKYLKINTDGIIMDSSFILNRENLNSVKDFIGQSYSSILQGLLEDDYLLLGEVKSKEHYREKDIFNFDLRKHDFTNSLEFKNLLEANHKILQSKFGYGSNGQIIQKNNILHIEAPYQILKMYGGDYELNTQTNIRNVSVEELIRNRLPLSRDIVLTALEDSPDVNVVALTTESNKITFSWEGFGLYKIYRRLTSLYSEEKTLIHTDNNSSRPGNDLMVFVDNFTSSNVISPGETLYYTVTYNDGPESTIVGVKKAL